MGSAKITYKRKLPAWMVTGFAGNIIGCIFMLLSPGTSDRLSSAGGFGNILTWIKRAFLITFDVMEYLLPAIMLLAALIIYITIANSHLQNAQIRNIPLKLAYAVGTLASIYSMIVSPNFPERAWSGPIILFIVLIGNVISDLEVNPCLHQWCARMAVLGVLSICIFGSCINTYFDLKNVYIENSTRIESILSQIADGEQTIYIKTISSNSKYSCFQYYGDLSEDSSEWPNTDIAKFYGAETIEILH